MSLVFSGSPEVENKIPVPFKKYSSFCAIQKNTIAYFVVDDKTKGWKVKKVPGYVMYIVMSH
ncbi:hypothetical protein EJ377_00535 [Chryseobacterium arthrosphaerae]|uniref:Uncharacterized protein n=1 Tax=Chryseobacterium arthrosphaerae TaxID=651561 RepID=A0A432DYG5_9FLAO|nr:hypothetical protein EJ377_00535 [Chryseobacterium arthrosphaerae]